MAATVEGLLENLISQSSKQDSKFMAETKKAEARHAEILRREDASGKDDDKRDEFARKQQGQEVQLSKRTQHHTYKSAAVAKPVYEEVKEMTMGPGNIPKWDKSSPVMTSDDAQDLQDNQINIAQESEKLAHEQQASLNILALSAEKDLTNRDKWELEEQRKYDEEKAKDESEKKYQTKDANIQQKIKDDQKKGILEGFQKQKARFDANRKDQAKLAKMTGAIKTDASLIFGSLGALTAIPGIQTMITASKFLLSNIYLLLVNSLLPAFMNFSRDVGKNLFEGAKKFFGSFAKLALVVGSMWKFMKKSGRALEGRLSGDKIKQRLRILREGKDKKGGFFEGKEGLAKGFGNIGALIFTLLKPIRMIIGLFNPLKKLFWIAVIGLGGLYSLFKSVGGTKEGFFGKMNEYMAAIKDFWTREGGLKDMLINLKDNILKPLWDIFLNDILPLFGWIFDTLVWAFKKAIVPIAKLLGKIIGLIFKYYGWIYDKIFRPLLKAFDIVESDPDQMDERGLRAERDALLRDKDNQGFWRRFGADKQARLADIEARIAAGQGATSGSEISGLNGDINDLNAFTTPPITSGGNFNAANSINHNYGNKSIISNTGTSQIGGVAFQGSNSIV